MKKTDAIRLFGLNNLSIESDIRRIQNKFNVDLGHEQKPEDDPNNVYYPQFTERLRTEAAEMAKHYAVFYCLENSIRELIVDRLKEKHKDDWWSKCVPEAVRKNAEANHKKEIGSGITPRSEDIIDYTNFGELSEIIKSNWEIFGDMLRDQRAVEKILSNLNTLRAPIAHCKVLAEDEVTRLNLGLRDWFRQME